MPTSLLVLRPYGWAAPPSPGRSPERAGACPRLWSARPDVWEHRNVSQPLGLRHGRHPGAGAVQVLISALLAALLVGAAANEAAGCGHGRSDGDRRPARGGRVDRRRRVAVAEGAHPARGRHLGRVRGSVARGQHRAGTRPPPPRAADAPRDGLPDRAPRLGDRPAGGGRGLPPGRTRARSSTGLGGRWRS